MKNEYNEVKLGDFVKIRTGKLNANAGILNGQYPFFTCSRDNLKIDSYSYDCECVLVAGNGDLNVKYYKGKFDAYQRTYIVESQNKDLLNVKYLYYFLSKYVDILRQKSIGGVIKYIKLNNLTDALVPLPSLEEQKLIVKELDKVNLLIEKRKEAITLLDKYLESVFLDMFGDPVSNPKKWVTNTIEQIAKKEKYSIKRGPFGGSLKKDMFVEDGYLVYEQFHALNRDFSFARYYVDEKKFQELKAFEVKAGDIIISCSGVYLGKLAEIPQNYRKGIINQALLKISLDNRIMKNQVFMDIFTNPSFKAKYLDNKIGSGIPNFPPVSVFKTFQFICPDIDLQKEYENKVKEVENLRKKIQKQILELEELMKSLSQKYFSN